MKKINIEFTKEQFLQMMKLTFIWEMVINWQKVGDFDEKSQDFQKFILKQAIDNKVMDYLYFFEWSKDYDIDNDISMDFYTYISDYCEESFYEDLTEILAKNIMFDKYTEKEIEKMWEIEYERNISKFTDKINYEFESNDYDNLTVNFKNKNPLFV